MAIRDLFWCCPACGRTASLRSRKNGDVCGTCGAELSRAEGADIALRTPHGDVTTRTATAWMDILPPLSERVESGPVGPERAVLRLALPARPVLRNGRLLGFGERFGPRRRGTITLGEESLRFTAANGELLEYPLDAITALQPSSTALQINARDRPVASIRFLDRSVRLWEAIIQERLRELFRRRGAGEIVEFQPRICTR